MQIDFDAKELGLIIEATKRAAEVWEVIGNENRSREYKYLSDVLEGAQGHYVNEQIKAIV